MRTESSGKQKRTAAGRTAAAVIAAVLLALPVTATVAAAQEQAADDGTTAGAQKQTISLLYKYDSTDTAVVRSVNMAEGTVTLCQHELGRYYTLRVDNTSMIYDRYGRPISASLLEPGDVADVTFLHQSKHLNSLVVSNAVWVRENVKTYRIDTDRELLSFDGQNYHLPATALLLNRENGVGERIIAEELLEGDVLTVYGIDKEIYSVVVTSGHGYLRLTSTEVGDRDIEGAWVNLGNKVIQRVNARTLIAAPEGDYTLQIIGQGANDSRPVRIERGKETVIDTSTIRMETPDVTEVTFIVEPEDVQAELKVDGDPVAIGLPVYLTQGVHQFKVRAEGYLTITQHLKVGEKKAKVELTLEKDPDAAAAASTAAAADTAGTADTAYTAATAGTSDWWNSSSGYAGTGATEGAAGMGDTSNAGASSGATVTTVTTVDVSGNETTRTTLTGYEVRVESPTGVEFYLDGSYMGITPTSFVKVSGQHTVTLSRDGYETKSYNIFIDDAQSNKTYAFPELVKSE
ncbi:MAG: PEGA domain-containing protein [Lachnospiraceae bacterium]|nr:PEGA domain-containing protein [Lachnospiraceae bacterium]